MRISDWSSDVCSSDLVAQRLAIFRTAADRVRRISGETMIPDFFLIDTDALPTEEDPRNPGKRKQLLMPREGAAGGVARISHWPAGFTEGMRQMGNHGNLPYARRSPERH